MAKADASMTLAVRVDIVDSAEVDALRDAVEVLEQMVEDYEDDALEYVDSVSREAYSSARESATYWENESMRAWDREDVYAERLEKCRDIAEQAIDLAWGNLYFGADDYVAGLEAALRKANESRRALAEDLELLAADYELYTGNEAHVEEVLAAHGR